jgi:hypothetical protein
MTELQPRPSPNNDSNTKLPQPENDTEGERNDSGRNNRAE